jgi:hypothetical protein
MMPTMLDYLEGTTTPAMLKR